MSMSLLFLCFLIALFFILPPDLWKIFVRAVCKIFPFNGGGFSYSSLVCARKIFSVKTALKDVWAFNVSLLAVRSPLFSDLAANYHELPHVNVLGSLFIRDHRDAAAVDFWRSDGTLVPITPP